MKASREQVRSATSEESLGAELIQELSQALLEDIDTGQLRNYRDVQGEGAPDDFTHELRPEPELPVLPPLLHDPDVPMEEAYPQEEETPQVPPLFDTDDLMEPETPVPEPMTAESTRASTEMTRDMEVDEPPVPTTVAPSTTAPSTPKTSTTPRTLTTPRRTIRVDEGPGGSVAFGPAQAQQAPRSMPYPFSQPGLAPWPSSNMYYNVLSAEKEINTVFWKYQKSNGDPVPKEINEETFELKDSHGIFDDEYKHMFISKAKESPGQVVLGNYPLNKYQLSELPGTKRSKAWWTQEPSRYSVFLTV